MASSRDTSNGPDWRDVARAALEFSNLWQGVVTIHLRPYGTQNAPKMTVVASLWADQKSVGVAKPLASASVNLPGTGGGDFDAVALLALYELDREVFRREAKMPPETA